MNQIFSVYLNAENKEKLSDSRYAHQKWQIWGMPTCTQQELTSSHGYNQVAQDLYYKLFICFKNCVQFSFGSPFSFSTFPWDKLVARTSRFWVGNILALPFSSDTYVCLSRPLSQPGDKTTKPAQSQRNPKEKQRTFSCSAFQTFKHSDRCGTI